MEKDQEFRNKFKEKKKKEQEELNKEFYQTNNYYNVFGNVEENISQ